MSYIDNRILAILLPSLLGADGRRLTPEELDRFIRCLLAADWESADSPIRLREDLTLGQVTSSRFFDQTRIFLRLLAEDKGMALTARGNLNRAGVAKMVEHMAWPRATAEYARKVFHSKKFDEPDIAPLHHIRIVCECGKLTFKRRGLLLATRKARALCEDAAAGRLFRHLFIAFFRRFSLDYLSGFPETPFVQDSIGVILWRLSLKAPDWIPAGKLPPEVFLPQVRDQITRTDPWPSAESGILVLKVLEPLCWFGLLQGDTRDDDDLRPFEDRKYRKTPLFDQFMTFIWQS
jgi:hypothetical protein